MTLGYDSWRIPSASFQQMVVYRRRLLPPKILDHEIQATWIRRAAEACSVLVVHAQAEERMSSRLCAPCRVVISPRCNAMRLTTLTSGNSPSICCKCSRRKCRFRRGLRVVCPWLFDVNSEECFQKLPRFRVIDPALLIIRVRLQPGDGGRPHL